MQSLLLHTCSSCKYLETTSTYIFGWGVTYLVCCMDATINPLFCFIIMLHMFPTPLFLFFFITLSNIVDSCIDACQLWIWSLLCVGWLVMFSVYCVCFIHTHTHMVLTFQSPLLLTDRVLRTYSSWVVVCRDSWGKFTYLNIMLKIKVVIPL